MAACLDEIEEKNDWDRGEFRLVFSNMPSSVLTLSSLDGDGNLDVNDATSDETRKRGGGKMTRKRRPCVERVTAHTIIGGSSFLKERKLRMAANSGNFDQVRKLLEEGVNVRAADDHGRTSLHFAASRGNVDIVSLLISNGADVNQRDRIGNTGLHLAACIGRIDVVTVLLKAGTDVNAEDMAGHTPLQLARGRLRLLTEDKFLRAMPFRLRQEVAQIVDLLKVYLHRTGDTESGNQLEALGQRLASTATLEEVDEIQDVLAGFMSLSLQKEKDA